jgi:hypothetical protein
LKKTCIALLACSGLSLAAQDHAVSLLYTMSQPNDYTQEGTHFETDTYKGLGLRYSQTVAKAYGARLDFEGTWKLRTSGSDLKVGGMTYPSSMYAMRQESMGLGLSATWTRVIDYGVALDLRHENTSLRVESSGDGQINFDQTTVRPWLGFRLGYTFATKPVKPFLGVEYGIPLAKHEGGTLFAEFNLAQKLRPKSELSITVGLRF